MTTPIQGTKTFPLSEGDTEGSITLKNETGKTIADYKLHVNSDDFFQPEFCYIKVTKTKDENGNTVSELINSAGNPNSTESYGTDFHRNIPTKKHVKPGEEITIIYKLNKGADEPAHIQVSLSTIVEDENGGHHVPIIGGTDIPHEDTTFIGKSIELIEIIKGIYNLISPFLTMASTKDQAIMTSFVTVIAMKILTNNELREFGNIKSNKNILDEKNNLNAQEIDTKELVALISKVSSDPQMKKLIKEFVKSINT